MAEWLTLSSAKDAVLFLLAIYGAALSTFNWRQAVRKERRAVRVTMSTVMPTQGNQVGPCFAKVEATNIGHRPVTITTLALELPSGGRMYAMVPHGFPFMPDTALPISLQDGQTAHVFHAYRDIAAALTQSGRTGKTKLIPVCEDSAGGVYRGKPWTVDPAEFSGM